MALGRSRERDAHPAVALPAISGVPTEIGNAECADTIARTLEQPAGIAESMLILQLPLV
jgi:hypothetical protein